MNIIYGMPVQCIYYLYNDWNYACHLENFCHGSLGCTQSKEEEEEYLVTNFGGNAA